MNYKPSAWQERFHKLPTDEALAGGSAGPGKSMALLMDPTDQVWVEEQRCRRGEITRGHSVGWALHLRREFPRLQQTIHRSKLLFPKIDPGVRWIDADHMWRFSSGYKYQFGHLKDNDSFLNYRSNEYTWLGIDEVGEMESKDGYDELCLRVRSTDPVLSKSMRVRCTSNPVGNWVRDYFVDPAPQGKVIFRRHIDTGEGIVTRTRVFLPATLDDNPSPEFRRQYRASLMDKPEHIQQALLYGNWYVVVGAYFADAWQMERVVINPHPIAAGLKKFRTGDWGYRQPCVILWWAVTPENELICYRERTYNGPKAQRLLDAEQVALDIRRVEMEHGEWNRVADRSKLSGFMDNQLWEERGHKGPTMASDMANVGVLWQRATKGRRQAAQQVVKRLKVRGYNGRPGLMFFSTCRMCISTIPTLPADKDEDYEVPEKGPKDHWYDAVSYACAASPLPNEGPETEPEIPDEVEMGRPRVEERRGNFGYGGW